MVSLHGQDPGRGAQVGLARDQRGRPLVGGHADILEDESPEEEEVLAGEGIEGRARRDHARRLRG